MDLISPNQNQNCLAVGSSEGYKVYSLKDLQLISKQEKQVLAIKFVEMYYLTNIIMFVYERNDKEIIIWDDYSQTQLDILTFENTVHRMILREKRLYVLTSGNVVEIIDMRTFAKITEIPNVHYFKGMSFEIPSGIDEFIGWNTENSGVIKLVSLHHLPKILQENDISLHKNNKCRNFVFNRRGTQLASNSKGTIVKLYDVHSKTKKSFSLNLLSKEISCLFFVPGQVYLIVVEDGGNVKILDNSGLVSEDINVNTNIFQKITRETAWMNFNIPLKKSRVCFNETNKCLFFYSADREILQYEINFKEKTHNLIKTTILNSDKLHTEN